MNTSEIQRALKIARAAVTEAGKELIKHYGNIEAEAKSTTGQAATDIVTKLDGQTEEFLARELAKFDPNVGFRGEESGVQSEGRITWLVDPIDGTSHFVRGLPFCTTMVALIEDGQVVMCVIHDFVNEDTYYATRGGGAFKNEEPIRVSNRSLSKSLLSFETRLDNPEYNETYLKLGKAAGGLISTVNSGFEFAMVASGKLDGRLTTNPYGYDWDFAPGSLLVEEAGGIVRNIGESTYLYTNHDFIATNPSIYRELTEGDSALFPLK